MKIYAASKEDILRRQQENENWYQESNARYESQTEEYGKANKAQMDKFEQAIYDRIGKYVEPLELRIYVSNEYYGDYSGPPTPYYDVQIECHQRDLFKTDQSLSWDYRVTLDADGNVEKESGCCTGLKATNDVQIQDLKLSVECLEILNNIDWKLLMDSIFPPNRGDYITEKDPKYQYNDTKSQLDRELEVAEVEGFIGTNTLVKLKQGKYYRGQVWAKLYSQSEKQFTIAEMGDYLLDERYNDDLSPENLRSYLNDTYRISKDKFFANLVKPMETMII